MLPQAWEAGDISNPKVIRSSRRLYPGYNFGRKNAGSFLRHGYPKQKGDLMNRTTRFVVAAVLALILVAGGISVWAGPARQGTVPIPVTGGGECEGSITEWVGTFTVTVVGADCSVIVTPITEEEAASKFGALADGKEYVAGPVNVAISGEAASTTVCFAYSPDAEASNAAINVFTDGQWTQVEGEIVDGPPRQICYSEQLEGDFALIGDN
jgi:hypothetical protein